MFYIYLSVSHVNLFVSSGTTLHGGLECRNMPLISDPQISHVQLLRPLARSACKKVICIPL